MKRIGMLTSGGDCQALNATMRGVVKGLFTYTDDVEIYGFLDGYKGLIYSNFRMLTAQDFSGILTKGGTILGSSRQPFKLMRVPDENGLDKVEAMKHTYHKLNLDCLVILGGNGTQKTGQPAAEEGLNIVGLPKTIDNDIWGTDMTFGFQSAVDIATSAIDCIHTTAASHGRVFIVEVMGHKVGWLTLHAGIAGGADIILSPGDSLTILDKPLSRQNPGAPEPGGQAALPSWRWQRAPFPRRTPSPFQERITRKRSWQAAKYPSVSYELAQQVLVRSWAVEVRSHRAGAHPARRQSLPLRPGAVPAAWALKQVS